MSSYTQRVTNSSVTITDYDRVKVACGQNHYQKRVLINLTGAETTFLKGTVLGVINTGANAGKVRAFSSANSDGSEIPRFVLNSTRTLADAAEANVSVIDDGIVNDRTLLFINEPTDAIDTNIDLVGTPRDLLMANSAGIKAEYVQDSTLFDN